MYFFSLNVRVHMQFTAKTYSLNEKFHTGLHVGVNGRTDGHVLTEISRYHFSLPMVLRYKYPMASTMIDFVKRETSSALRFDCFWRSRNAFSDYFGRKMYFTENNETS